MGSTQREGNIMNNPWYGNEKICWFSSSNLKLIVFFSQMQGHPVFKRVSGLSEPVVTKGQEVRHPCIIIY